MIGMTRLFLTSAAALGLAACSGGESAPKQDTTAAANVAEPAATPSPAAPAADNTDTVAGVQLASFTGTAAAGEAVFVQCRTCHVTDAGQNRIGPSLAGIIGRPAGTVAGYNYTPANKNSGITWTKEKMFQYLENPQRVVPGTKMAFAGIQDPQKRADLIEWLATK